MTGKFRPEAFDTGEMLECGRKAAPRTPAKVHAGQAAFFAGLAARAQRGRDRG